MFCWPIPEDNNELGKPAMHPSKSLERMFTGSKIPPTEFPPPGYRPTPINHLLVNALDLTAPASDALLKNRKNAWVQVAGHPGSFAPASQNTIWKKQPAKDNTETPVYHKLMGEHVMRDIVPKFHREVNYGGEIFIEIEDLLQHFVDPSIMDVKIGIRTFLESEVQNQKLRPDFYEKMVAVAPEEPTEEENKQKAITKLRYMEFRERNSSTSTLGFRIDAMKMSGEEPIRELQKIKTETEVKQVISQFLNNNKDTQKKLLKRFKEMRRKLEMSKFLFCHEIIGSSLLVMFDKQQHCSAWLIDFGKTRPIEGGKLNHRTPWQLGNNEDGYLTGLDNLIRVFSELNLENCQQSNGVNKLTRFLSRNHKNSCSGNPVDSAQPRLQGQGRCSPCQMQNHCATSAQCHCKNCETHQNSDHCQLSGVSQASTSLCDISVKSPYASSEIHNGHGDASVGNTENGEVKIKISTTEEIPIKS